MHAAIRQAKIDKDTLGGVIEADEVAVAEMNALVLQNAYREVYASRPTTSFALAGELLPAASVIEYMRRYGTTQAGNTGGQAAEAAATRPQTQQRRGP